MTTRLLVAALLSSLCFGNTEASAGIKSIEVDAKTGAARAVVVEKMPLAHTSQFLPTDSQGNIIGKGNVDEQLKAAFNAVGYALKDGGADLDKVVKLNVYAANNDVVTAAQKFFAANFNRGIHPAVTYVISKLASPDALVAMDAIGVSARTSSKSVVRTHSSKIGPAGEFADVAVLPKGGVIYISGQAQKGVMAEATAKTLDQLEQTLKFLNREKKDVVFAKAFVQPATDAAVVRAEFAKFFKGDLVPPLALVDWSSGKDLPIEIEMVVAAGDETSKETNTVSYLCPPFMTGSPVYSKIARVNSGNLIYLSGITGKSTNSAEAEIHEIFADLKDIVQKAGSDMDHLVKATYYVSNPQTSGKLNEIRPKYYNPKTPPAASKALVQGVGFSGKGITFDMIAVGK